MNRSFLSLAYLILLSSGLAFGSASQVEFDPHPHVITLGPPTIEQFDGAGAMPRLAERAPLLFLGTVTMIEAVPGPGHVLDITLRVKKAWKGLSLTTLTVRTGDRPYLSFSFMRDQEYLVAAKSTGDAPGILGLYPGFTPIATPAANAHIQALDAWRRAKYDAGASK